MAGQVSFGRRTTLKTATILNLSAKRDPPSHSSLPLDDPPFIMLYLSVVGCAGI